MAKSRSRLIGKTSTGRAGQSAQPFVSSWGKQIMAGTFHSFSANFEVQPCVAVAVTAAVTHGTAVDCQGYRRACALCYASPSGAGTTGDFYIEECATVGGSYTKVTGSDAVQATTVGGAQVQMIDIDLARRQRFLKVVFTGAGGSAAGVASAFIVLGEPGFAATSNTPTPVVV